MKRFFFLCLLFLVLTNLAQASTDPGIKVHLATAKTVYLTKVTSVKDGHVTFSITETLRGEPRPSLVLTPELGFDFKENTLWILISMPAGGKKDGVGGVMLGWSDWYPVAVVDDASIKQIKEILKQNPLKP